MFNRKLHARKWPQGLTISFDLARLEGITMRPATGGNESCVPDASALPLSLAFTCLAEMEETKIGDGKFVMLTGVVV